MVKTSRKGKGEYEMPGAETRERKGGLVWDLLGEKASEGVSN